MATPWIRRWIVVATSAFIAGAVLVHAVPPKNVAPRPVPARPLIAGGIQKIKHVIVVMQENRSFDNYFGTFPVRTASRGEAGNRPSASRTRTRGTASSRSTTRT